MVTFLLRHPAKAKREFGLQPRGYYVPRYQRSPYFAPGVMTAYAHGDMIAANSFMGAQPPLTYYDTETDESVSDFEQNEDSEKDIKDITSTEKTVVKQKPTTPRVPQIDENEESDSWPFARGGIPNYNAFFPIMIGGYSGSGGRERKADQNGFPGGSATAIANSFSTGKGGVASSHATAYGDPYLSTLLRNGNGLRKKMSAEPQE